MNFIEETIEATLDANGHLQLTQQPRMPPGPVQVTIRAAATPGRGLADLIRDLATEQRSRGFPGRSAESLRTEDDERAADDDERDAELDAARRGSPPRGP